MQGRNVDHVWSVVLDAPDALELGEFYRSLLGWEMNTIEPDWVTLKAPSGNSYLSFAGEHDAYVRPVWPAEPGRQQMMMHLDIEVGDLDAATAGAVALGAELAAFQPQRDVRVMLDPAGHPFCLWLGEPAPAESDRDTVD